MVTYKPVNHFLADLPLPAIRPLWQHLVGDCGEVIVRGGGRERTLMDTELAPRLLAAAKAGDVAQVRAVVPSTGIPEEDGLPNAPDGITLLIAAAAAGHEAVVELLAVGLWRRRGQAQRKQPPRRRLRPRRGPPLPGQAPGHRGRQGPDDLVRAAAPLGAARYLQRPADVRPPRVGPPRMYRRSGR